MVNFIQSADANIKINEDVSYLLNNALHVNAVFTATDAVTAGKPVLRVNLPNVGAHAKINWCVTGSDPAPSAAATVKNTTSSDPAPSAAATVTNTTSSVNGLHNITIQLSADVAASKVYHIAGWIALP